MVKFNKVTHQVVLLIFLNFSLYSSKHCKIELKLVIKTQLHCQPHLPLRTLSEICFTILKNTNICQFIFANQVPAYTKLLIYIRLERWNNNLRQGNACKRLYSSSRKMRENYIWGWSKTNRVTSLSTSCYKSLGKLQWCSLVLFCW